MSQNQPIKNIEVGKFYFIHDGSKTGHPGFVVWKDDEKNLYLVIKFGTTSNDNNFSFGRPVGDKTTMSFVYKKMFLGKRKDFDRRVLKDMHISNEEVGILLKKISMQNPTWSTNINRKDKRYFKWIIKQK